MKTLFFRRRLICFIALFVSVLASQAAARVKPLQENDRAKIDERSAPLFNLFHRTERQTTNPNAGVVDEQPVELPVVRRSPPKISLPRALKLAESRMKKQNIIASRHYLAEAKYTLVNFEGASFPCWRLLWIQADNQGSDEHDIWAYVFMDGRVSFSPKM